MRQELLRPAKTHLQGPILPNKTLTGLVYLSCDAKKIIVTRTDLKDKSIGQ